MVSESMRKNAPRIPFEKLKQVNFPVVIYVRRWVMGQCDTMGMVKNMAFFDPFNEGWISQTIQDSIFDSCETTFQRWISQKTVACCDELFELVKNIVQKRKLHVRISDFSGKWRPKRDIHSH